MSGIGLMVRPLPGWREWLSGLSSCPDATVLDCRGAVPDDVLPLPSEGLALLVDQHDWSRWSSQLPVRDQHIALAVYDAVDLPEHAIPCVSSLYQLHLLSRQPFSVDELWLLPGDVAGLCGDTAAFVLIQEVLNLFPQARLVLVSSTGPEVAATLLNQGVDTVLLADQLILLADYPLSSDRQRSIARLQRGVIRRFSVDTPGGPLSLQIAPLDPLDWRQGDPAVLERHAEMHFHRIVNYVDDRLTPISEGVLLSRVWSEIGFSCSDLLRYYQRFAVRQLGSLPSAARGRAAMASRLGTRLPIVQGPMTRVSDVAAFAHSVASAGGMPVIAAAMLSADHLNDIVRDTAELCEDLPWGVGLLAFRPELDLKPQIEVVLKTRPNLVILAGGHPAQISQFGDLADRVFLHSPTPELFERQLMEGCRHFILEGRECGGHTGPCSSLSLWEGCLKVLAQEPRKVQEETAILFAGGVYGAKSSVMIADLLQQFNLSDLCHGVLVGTLTLFSEEAVSSGAISNVFQKVLLETEETVLLETAPGHQSRCAKTPFTDEFLRQRRHGLDQGLTGSELAALLDGLILGRLRLASKGLRRQGDQLVLVSEDEQLHQGMFMVGEVAALLHQVEPLHQLFQRLLPAEPQDEPAAAFSSNQPAPAPIAITGIAVALPGASSLTAYWSLILRQHCQIRVVPEDRWPAESYYASESSPTSVVSRWGTFIEPTIIDLAPYPLTPAQVAVTETTQILALDLVSQALGSMAPMALPLAQRERTAVVFAASGGVGELGQAYTVQTALASDPEQYSAWLDSLPSWTNSSFPGLLSNVTAGRVCNAFDLSGSNLVVDAACASGLAAVDVAVAKLRSGECDRAIVGSVDNLQGPFPYFCFSQSGALSRQGQSRPFCIESDGIVIGEGCAVIVLERLDDASRSGAEIFAVIDAVGSSSDGKGRSLTAPSHRGQMLAFDRAFASSDRHPSELRYYEAHGTGTPVGDRSEIAALTGFLHSWGVNQQRCAVGSVKALIGHTKATAGLAGLIKAALALRHGTLPGQQPIDQPLPELTGDSPVYVPATASPWPALAGERLAAVSAFGFGGTNFTVLLSDRHRRRGQGVANAIQPAPIPSVLSVIALPLARRNPLASLRQFREQLGHWLLQLAGINRPINSKIIESPLLQQYSPTWPSAAFLAMNRFEDDGLELLDALERRLMGEEVDGLLHVSGVSSTPISAPALVLVFTGQGSVYPGMGSTWMLSSPRVRKALELLQNIHPDPDLITRVLGESRSPADRHAFWTPSVMQVVLMLHQLAALDWIFQLGLRPNAVLGHSIGDYLALHASGALPLEDLVRLIVERALCLERCIDSAAPGEAGGMLVVKEPLDVCEVRLFEYPRLKLSNRNAPLQGVVAGPLADLSNLQVMLESEGIETIRLDLPVAYHHPSLQPAALDFAHHLEQVTIYRPVDGCTISLSTDPERELRHPGDIFDALSSHLCSSVDFAASVDRIETRLQGAIYVDLGPRHTGRSLLQANGVATERVLCMDDRKDPMSQPLRVAFALLQRGFPLDEAALMRLASEPRHTSSLRGPQPSLPFIVNGHAAVPLEGRPLPASPLVPISSTKLSPVDVVPMPESDSDRLLEVYAEYQKTMRKFLESQDQVFSVLAGGPHAGIPAPAEIIDKPDPPRVSSNTPHPVASLATPSPLSTSTPESSVQPQPQPHTPSSSQQTVTPQSAVHSQQHIDQTVDGSVSDVFSSDQAMQGFITDVLVDRTGYPPELLELDAHLESDLGIDSIKQVEVLGALIEKLPGKPSSDQMQEIRAVAREKQTIRELADFMLTLHSGKN